MDKELLQYILSTLEDPNKQLINSTQGLANKLTSQKNVVNSYADAGKQASRFANPRLPDNAPPPIPDQVRFSKPGMPQAAANMPPVADNIPTPLPEQGRFAKPGLDLRSAGVPSPPEGKWAHSDFYSRSHQPSVLEQNRGSYGRLATDPARMLDVLQTAGKVAMAPVNAADRLMQRGPTHPGDIDSGFVRDALTAGGITLTGAAAIPEGTALGASGGRILARPRVADYIRKELDKGIPPKRIAQNLNERHAEELPDGDFIKEVQIKKFRDPDYQRVRDTDKTMLDISQRGQYGGRGRTSGFNNPGEAVTSLQKTPPPPGMGGNLPPPETPTMSVDLVKNWMKDAGIPIVKENNVGGTNYLKYNVPGNPPRKTPGTPKYETTPYVRIPSDTHIGRLPRFNEMGGNYLDTGSTIGNFYNRPNMDKPAFDVATKNASGGSYSDPQNLFDALRWRTSRDPKGQFLIPPGQEPRGIINKVEPPQAPTPPDPNQLQLLSGGLPINPDWIRQILSNNNGT